ncbi:MAG: GMC family oxidoreductase [Thermodesulfobacteriota bacterium]
MPPIKKKYDCLVVGSGPGGAPFAWKLASKGMNVLLLEAGPRYDPYKSYALDEDNWESKGFPEIRNIRHTFGKKQPLDGQYENLRSWNKASGKLNPTKERRYLKYHQISGIGGTTLHYQGEAHRLNEDAFRMKSRYGVAVDWPIEYKDLEPYYAETEGILGVAGPDTIPGRPRSKPYPLKPHKLSYASKIVEKACRKQGIDLIPNSVAILSGVYRDAPPCNYCNGCVWGCPRKDKGSVDVTFIPLAEKTGTCEIIDNVYVTRIEIDNKLGKKRAVGVVYYDRGGKEHFVGGDYIAVACGAVETPRLLLNSDIKGNGLVGKNFMETTFYEAVAMHPERLDSYRGIPIDSIIWKWNNPDPERGFPGGLRLFPTAGSALGPVNYSLRYFEGWGENYVKEIEKWFGHAISVGGIAEFFPNNDTFVTLDPKIKDQFGSPVAQIQSFLGEPELKSLEFISKKSKEILKASGAGDVVEEVSSYDFFSATHVFGTCRMGEDRETSVVNPSLRVHSIPNLLVTDASVFPTSGGGEAPSLTIEALSLRAADLLLRDIKKG